MRFLSLIGLLSAASLSFGADLPKPSPEFVINYTGGEQKLLSKFRGKVVLLEFLYTTCPHCQHTAGEFSKLQNEFGPRGFQALGVAFNEMSAMLVPDFIKDFKPAFPVGFSESGKVLNYLGIGADSFGRATERFVVPQVILIDRKGMIRAMSPPLGDASLQDEKFMRVRIEELLSGVSAAKPAPMLAKPSTSAAAKPSVVK